MTEPVTTSILIGLAISAATAAASYLLTPPPPDQEGPRRDDLTRTTSAYGKFRPITYGTVPNAGNLIDSSVVYPIPNEEEVGGKGGKSSTLTTYTYQQDLALGLGEGVIQGVVQIFANEELIYDVNGSVVKPSWLDFKFYPGSETQQPDPTLQAIHGVENTPAYLGEAYIVFIKFNLSAFGDRIPNFRVVTTSDANSSSTETTVQCNPDFDTTIDTLLTLARMHPVNGYMVHGWAWDGVDGRQNPAGTVTDPYSNQYLFSLNAPADVGGLTYTYPSFGTLPKYEYGIQINGPYEHVLLVGLPIGGDSLSFMAYSAYSDVLDAHGTLLNSIYTEFNRVFCYAHIGSVVNDDLVIYGLYRYGDVTEYALVYWEIAADGDVPLVIAVADMGAAIPNWYPSNLTVNTNGLGTLLIYSDLDGGITPSIIKYTHKGAFDWVIPVPPSFATTSEAVNRAVYDEVNERWWSMVAGKIWAFSDLTGETVGSVIDISADPNYVSMGTRPSFSPDTRKLYWVSSAGVAGDVAGSWDTVTGEVSNYPVDSYESSPTTLTSLANTNYFYPTDALFYSSQGVTLEDPSRRFRLQNLTGNAVPISTIFDDICRRCGVPTPNYDTSDVSGVLTEGYRITNLATGRANSAPLQHGFLVDVVDSGGVLKFIQKGKASVATLTADDLGASSDPMNPRDPIQISRVMESQLPSHAEIVYMNPDSNYEPGAQQADRAASSNVENLVLNLPIVFKDTPAKQLIDVVLHQLHIERERYEISTMPAWQYLEAGDSIDVDLDGTTLAMQFVNTAFVEGVMQAEAVRVERSVLTSYLEGEAAPPKNDVVAFPGIMVYGLLDLPLLRDIDNTPGFYSAATSYTDPWAGGVLYKSPDNTAWNVGGTFTSASIYGTTNDVLPAPVDPWQWDTLNTITVQLVSGGLHSVTKEQALQGFNSAAYGKDGRWEVLNYVNADPDPVVENVYHLSLLLRGRLGTDRNVNNHQVSDIFVPLKPTNLQYIGNDLADLNVVRYYRGASFGVNLYEPSNITTPFVNRGVSITPFSPQHIVGTQNSALDLTITWMPRSRYPSSNFWSGVASEPDDLYDIEIYLDGGTVPIRTVTDNNGSLYIWTREDQLTDADGTPQVVDISVWHKSQRLLGVGESGRGYEGTGRAVIGLMGDVPYHHAVDLLTSTVMHWRFDMVETVPGANNGQPCIDTKGNITNATYVEPGLLTFQPSMVPSNNVDPLDTSFYCNWNGDYAVAPSDNSPVFNTGNSFSVAFVGYFFPSGAQEHIVYRTGQFTVSLFVSTGIFRVFVAGPEGLAVFQDNIPGGVLDSLSHHWAVTVGLRDINDGSGIDKIVAYIYRDGVLVSDGTNFSTQITAISQPTAEFIAKPYAKFIDDLTFHDAELSLSEIAYLFSNTGL